MAKIDTVRNPNLPITPIVYDRQHFDTVHNVMRLYFNRIDALFQSLFGSLGGKFIESPHISALGTADQFASADNTPTLVLFDTVKSAAGFTLNMDGSATASQSGVYKIDYSLQFVNTDNVQHDVYVWLEVNGVGLAGSSNRFTVPARKSAGVFGYAVGYSSVSFTINTADQVTLYWATDKAFNSTGPVDGIYMEHTNPVTSPYDRPLNPSAIGSITFVSRNGT